VTGGSSGIGFELARHLAMGGYDLMIVADNDAKLRRAAADLAEMGEAPHVDVVTVDLSTREGVQALYDRVKQSGRAIDVLAANAGTGVTGDFARETDLECELKLIQLNVTSVVHLTKLILKDMVARGEGKILITSSLASTTPGPYFAVYAASKAFLRSFGQAIRAELQDTNITVTVLMPGPTDTEFFERAQMLDTKAGHGPKQSPAEVAEQAVRALEEGADSVVPGLMNKLQAGVNKLIPDKAGAKIQGALTKPQH
jgi:short-subunit dehydrogenase